MTYYGLEHPNPNKPQFRSDRREAISGCVPVHTVESQIDVHPPDNGAENTAAYLSSRTTYGSYHCIVDADTAIDYAPPSYETWHVAADHHNWHAWGIAFACAATDWGKHPAWDEAALNIAAVKIADFAIWWATNIKGDSREAFLVARKINRSDALARRAGICLHGELQPADRTDAWLNHPDAEQLTKRLVDKVAAVIRERLHPEDEMTPAQEAKLDAVVDDVEKIRSKVDHEIRHIEGTLGKQQKLLEQILEKCN